MEQLQKLGASDDQGNVDIDTGAVIFNSEMLQALYQLVDTKEKFAAYVNESTRLSFYADFSTLWHQTLRWSSIIKKHRKVILRRNWNSAERSCGVYCIRIR